MCPNHFSYAIRLMVQKSCTPLFAGLHRCQVLSRISLPSVPAEELGTESPAQPSPGRREKTWSRSNRKIFFLLLAVFWVVMCEDFPKRCVVLCRNGRCKGLQQQIKRLVAAVGFQMLTVGTGSEEWPPNTPEVDLESRDSKQNTLYSIQYIYIHISLVN